MFTTLYIHFSNAQGQLTQYMYLDMGSGRNSNSFKLSWLSLLPARKNKIQSKMKALECSQHFSHCKSMVIFSDVQGQLTLQTLIQFCRVSNPSKLLLLSVLPARIKKI